MDDTISRKAAIDAIMDADVCVTWNGVISDDDAVDIAIKSTKGSVISSIVNMPSAQPETHDKRTETHSCDLIDRQVAIDAIEKNAYRHTYLDQIIDIIKALPSAQPEIVRCGSCKYAEIADARDNQDGYTCQFHRGSIWFSGSYCSWAERRTDG